MSSAATPVAKRCQDTLDDRQRQLIAGCQSWWCFNAEDWENRAGELYQLAAEVARRE